MSRPPEAMRGGNATNEFGASRAPAAPANGANAGAGHESLVGKIVCPFCGQQKSASSEPCPRCTMEDTPATRQATKARIGPWYVLQNRSPSAPGMKYATLLWLVNKGHVTPRSVVRGPTTYQLWRYAAHVRGLSREFGLCYSCGGAVQKSEHLCPHCERPQDPPVDPDVLLDVRDGAGQLRTPVMREIQEPREDEAVRETRETRDPRATHDTRETREPRDVRAATEARRTPPQPVPLPPPPPSRNEAADYDEEEGEEFEEFAEVSASAAEPDREDRLRAHSEMIVRPRAHQDLARTGGRMVSATHLAAALREPTDAPPPRSRRWSALNVILFLLLLLSGAAAAALYFKPEYREPTAKWVGSTWTAVRTKLASMQWSSPPGEPPTPQRVPTRPAPQSTPAVPTRLPAPAPQLASDQQKQQQPPPVQVAKNDSPPKVDPNIGPKAETAKEQPKTGPKPSPATRPTTQPQPQLARDTTPVATQPQQQLQAQAQAQSPPQKDQSQPAPRDAKDRTAAAPPRDANDEARNRQPAEPMTLEQAIDESRKLRNQAIDAEGRNDYAAAMALYERIKKLPRDAWPGDLQLRIDYARDALKARSAKSD